jgi:hypothetical protein
MPEIASLRKLGDIRRILQAKNVKLEASAPQRQVA